ncbi:plasmid mobilization protein [Glutamicibacter arilaitensis]|uniref:plasmid mobilization protein n=1 Tax=Glutamicibacter arilaitensis TaxID=256701 RepID=UPI003FD630FA
MTDDQTSTPRRPGRPRADNLRTKKITIRLLPEELAELEKQAEAARIRLAVFARKKVTDSLPKSPRISPEAESSIRSVYAELGKIGSNLNQIARGINAANIAGAQVSGDEVRQQVTEAKYALRGIMDWLDQLS